MGRLMSVAYTEQAVRERRKTVTRRKGWWENKAGARLLLPGQQLTLCRKVMGRKKGEPLERICDVEVVSVAREPLSALLSPIYWPDGGVARQSSAEVAHEGFPGMDPTEFIRTYFVEAQGMDPDDLVTRVEWRYLDDEASA